MKTFLTFAALGLAAAFPTLAGAQEVTWRMGHINAIDSTYLITTKSIPERILEATDGRLKIELYDTLYPGSSQVGALREFALQNGAGVHVGARLEVSLHPDVQPPSK